MCYQVVERYSKCRCLYYQSSVDPCKEYGQRGHAIEEKTILVGYACPDHSDRSVYRADKFKNMPTYAAVGSPRATAPQEKPQPVTNTMSGDTVDPQLLGQEEYVVSDESKLVGSELIDLPAAAHELYVAEVVDDLYSQLPPGRVDYLALDRLSRILPNLLEAFAMRVGHSAQNQMHRDIMEFIHKFGL